MKDSNLNCKTLSILESEGSDWACTIVKYLIIGTFDNFDQEEEIEKGDSQYHLFYKHVRLGDIRIISTKNVQWVDRQY